MGGREEWKVGMSGGREEWKVGMSGRQGRVESEEEWEAGK